MKNHFLFLISFFIAFSVHCQTSPVKYNSSVDQLMEQNNDSLSSLDKIAAFITHSFTNESDKSRAVFYWVTKNISYSPDLMYTYKTTHNSPALVKETMQTKAAVCIGYAALVDTLTKLCGMKSFLVEGSTRQNFLPSIIGHAWNAVKIDSTWQLMDATWGSGFIRDNNFVRERHDNFFLPDPKELITTHLPLDPIWQMLQQPLTLHQFYTRGSSSVKMNWNFQDSIHHHLQLPEIEQISASIRRLEQFGTNSEITFNYYHFLKSKESDFYVKKLNHAGSVFNEAIELFSDYIAFKNKQFTPVKPDAQIAKMLPEIKKLIVQSKEELNTVPAEFTSTNTAYLENLKKHYVELEKRIETEEAFVKKYLATKKGSRKELFYVKIYGPVK